MYWLLIGRNCNEIIEAEDFGELHMKTDSDLYDICIRLTDDIIKEIKELAYNTGDPA